MTNLSEIDLPTFEALKDAMGADYIGELVQAYFDEMPKMLASLQEALSSRDSEVFRRAAHSIKSSSNSFGALKFGEKARELEMMGREGNLAGAAEKTQALEKDYGTVRQTLEELVYGKREQGSVAGSR